MVPVLASLTYQSTGCRKSILQALDLSNNKSLRSLEIDFTLRNEARRYDDEGDSLNILPDLLSTVTSPAFSDVVIILRHDTIRDEKFLQVLFRVVQNMYKVKPFHLVFWLGTALRGGEDDRERLKKMIGVQASEGGFGPLLHPPVVVSYTRTALWRLGRLIICGVL